jgi:hypothetical protein
MLVAVDEDGYATLFDVAAATVIGRVPGCSDPIEPAQTSRTSITTQPR